MTQLPVPRAQLAPLAFDGRDGIARLARRTQRGQAGRRVLVLVLVALAVGGGVASASLAASVARSDVEFEVADRWGAATATVTEVSPDVFGFTEPDPSPAQQEWIAAHPYTGPPLPRFSDDPPLTDVDLRAVAARVTTDVPAEDVLAIGTTGVFQFFTDDDTPLVTDIDTTHPLARGTFVVDGGPRALTGEEALLSPTLLGQLGAAVGDRVELTGHGEVDVVGTATRAAQRSQPVAIVAPGRAPEGGWPEEAVRTADVPVAERIARALEDERAAAQDAGQVMRATAEVQLRDEYVASREDPTTVAALVGGVVTGLATTFAALIATCAFAVGVRRRIREIGMLGAIGASPPQVRRLLRREGLLIGLGGAVLGAAAGAALVLAGLPLAERALDRELGLVVPPVAVLLPVLLGGLGALVASVWPARTAARVPVVTALAGRVPLGRVPAWLPVGGGAAAVLGWLLLVDLFGPTSTGNDTMFALQLLAATLLATLGTASLGLPVVALGGRIADRLPFLGRMALRDAARQRTRSGAAIAALVPVMAVPVASLLLFTSGDPGEVDPLTGLRYEQPAPSELALVRSWQFEGRTPPPDPGTVDRVSGALPTGDEPRSTAVVELGLRESPGPAYAVLAASGRLDVVNPLGNLALATPELLEALGLDDARVPPGELAFIDGSGWAQPPADVEMLAVAAVEVDGSDTGGLGVVAEVPARIVRAEHAGVPFLLVHPDLATELDLVEVGSSVLLELERPPTTAEAREVYEATGFNGELAPAEVWMLPTPPFWQSPAGVAVLTAAAVLAMLFVVSGVAGMTSALAATESDADVRKAVALGAAPSMRRRFHGVQAWWHSAVAVVLGTGLGLAVAAAAVRSSGSTTDGGEFVSRTLEVPWVATAAYVLGLPVLVGLVIAALMRSSPVGAPRRRTA